MYNGRKNKCTRNFNEYFQTNVQVYLIPNEYRPGMSRN